MTERFFANASKPIVFELAPSKAVSLIARKGDVRVIVGGDIFEMREGDQLEAMQTDGGQKYRVSIQPGNVPPSESRESFAIDWIEWPV